MSYMKPIRMDGGPDGIRCMSLACQSQGRCAPIGMTNSMPPAYIYPPDCSTGATDPRSLGHDAQPINFGNDMAAPNPLASPSGPQSGQSSAPSFDLGAFFGGMSTTTLLLLGGAAYFLFFRKHR